MKIISNDVVLDSFEFVVLGLRNDVDPFFIIGKTIKPELDEYVRRNSVHGWASRNREPEI
jgi:hypothetical protein